MSQAARILICVPCHNRKAIAAECLPTLRAACRPGDLLTLWNDGSTEYDGKWLAQFGDVVYDGPNIGVEAMRRKHLYHFYEQSQLCGYTHLYFTDMDAVHSPEALNEMLRLQEKYGGWPICGYDTDAHVRLPGNTLRDDPADEVIIRRVAPGISYLLTWDHVVKLMPHVDNLTAFDWQIPAILGGEFAVTRASVVDHIGRGGLRDPADYEGFDGGDRCRNPALKLIEMRADAVARLKANGLG